MPYQDQTSLADVFLSPFYLLIVLIAAGFCAMVWVYEKLDSVKVGKGV